jgi:hypothetical protein
MSRVKEFEATGLAPNGRLYAGDLLAIQDHYADLSNFAQVVGVGTLQIGDTSLMVVKYGTGEMRMTGAVRVDGILRGLGGLYAGAFTTTQRDAIPTGSRPYGVIILNTTTNSFEWNSGTDAVPSWSSLSGDLSLLPTAGEKQALAGTAGTPGTANKYVTNADPRVGTLSGDLSGLLPSPVVKKASTDFSLMGVITPPTITGDTNDYIPAGLATATIIRMNASVPVNITGLQGGLDGKFLILRNVGATSIMLKFESTLSAAANRFVAPTDVNLGPRESRMLQYDGSLGRWAILTTQPATDFIGASMHATVGGIAPGATVNFPWITDRDTNAYHGGTNNYVTIPGSLGGTYDIDWTFGISGGAAWFTGWLTKNGITIISNSDASVHAANVVLAGGDQLRLYYRNDTNQHDPYTHSVSATFAVRRTSI